MQSCYDTGHPLIRVTICAIGLLLAVPVLCAPPEADTRWRTVVVAPRPGLPQVEVEFGYAGSYVPALNSPITFRATGAHVPFDGYIGYHFVAGGGKTVDTPVIARAVIRPHGAWAFQTIATLVYWGGVVERAGVSRDLIVEWRDRAMKIIATQSAGIPPWTDFTQQLRPLLMTDQPSETVLGAPACVERADALPDRAQWYRGFSAVVMSLSSFLDLKKAVRESIFASGVYVILYGVPRVDQHLEPLDAALLPVVFREGAGSYEAPWPYRGSRAMPVGTRVTWTAKRGVQLIGAADRPYIASSHIAAWFADDVALAWPVPAIERRAWRSIDWLPLHLRRPTLLERIGQQSAPLAAGGAVILGCITWISMRKRPTVALALVLIVICAAVIVQRERLRPNMSLADDVTIREPIAPDVVVAYQRQSIDGPVPLAERPRDLRTTISGDAGGYYQAIEVRSSDSAVSAGTIYADREWDGVMQWTYRHELDTTAKSADGGFVVPQFSDFHAGLWFHRYREASARNFTVTSELTTQRDGRASCVISVGSLAPAAGQKATLTAGNEFAGRRAVLSWPGGTLALTLKKNGSLNPAAEIPVPVLRDAIARGGIFFVTIDAPNVLPYAAYRAAIHVQEDKS